MVGVLGGKIFEVHLLRRIKYGLTIFLLLLGSRAFAEWEVRGETNMFYTDDVSIFSASQRLSHREDPTQPVIDITNGGEDAVFEPEITVEKLLEPSWGELKIALEAQGFIFFDKTEFNHTTLGAEVSQQFQEETLLRFRYHYGPDLFLGMNREKRTGNELFAAEEVTTHFGVVELERQIVPSLMGRVLGRYGERTYNAMFKQRDTSFWTVGAHLEWEICPLVEWVLGYHYERGLADGRYQPQFEEDISSFTHYVVSEVDVHLTEHLDVRLGFDFELNTFTSGFDDDEHRNANEKIFQGEIEAFYEVNEHLEVSVGYQHGQRKFNFEPESANVNTIRAGSVFHF